MNNDVHYIRKELDHLQTKVKDFDVTTEYAYSDSDTVPPSSSAIWFDEKPVPVEGEFIWARNRMNMGYGDIVTEPFCIGDGFEHITSLDVEYIAWNDPVNAPSQDNPNWQTTAPSIQSGMYIWTRNVITTTHGTSYTSPVRLTGLQGERGNDGIDGKSGKDGKGIEFIFLRYASQIDWNNVPSGVVNPSTLPSSQIDDYVPNGWTDDQTEVTEALPYQYVSTRTKSTSGESTTGQWGTFNTPKLWSVYGEKPYCHIRYSDVNNPTNWNQTYATPQTSGSGEVNYHKYEGYLWNSDEVLQDVDKDPTKFSWRIYRPTIGVAGQEGSFLHIQYADDESGTNMNQYDGAYMGTCVTWEEIDPDDPDLYNWVRIKGTEGVGTEFVYFTTDNASYSSLPTNIINTPTLKRWCERPYAVSSQYQYCYVSVREYVDESWSNWSSPVLWAKYGATGQQGSAGENGEDGEGLELIFARNNSTSTAPTFQNNQNKASYTGTDSQGRHYQDSDFTPNGWTDNQSGVSANQSVEWVCMRFKRCPSGSKDAIWSDFNTPRVWATFSEDGRGVTSIKEQYALGDSYTVAPTSGWQNTPPTNVQGKFYWTRSVITYDDGTSETLNAICVSGIDGTGVHYVYYVTNTLSTPTTPTWSDINKTTPSNPYNKWLEDPYPIDASHKYIYISESTTYVKSSDSWSNFSTPSLWSRYAVDGTDGTNGTNGQGYEYAYYTSNSDTVPTKPSSNVTATSGYNKWTKIPIAMTSTYKYMYISYRTKTGSTYTDWSNTALWSQFGDKGDQGEKGTDGIGMEHIFYLTNSESPSWNNTTNPSKWTVQADTDEYILANSGWTDDATGVSANKRFEFVSIRTKTPNSSGVGKWGAYTSPSLWAKYGEKGEQGNKGDKGDKGNNGVHGDSVTSNAVIDKTKNTSFSETPVGSVSSAVPSNFVASRYEETVFNKGSTYTYDQSYIDSGGGRIVRQGNIVTLSFTNMYITSAIPVETGGSAVHYNLFRLPSWAIPVDTIFFRSVLDNNVLSVTSTHVRIRRLSPLANNNISGSVTYIVRDDTGKSATTLEWVSTSAVAQGGQVQVRLKSGNTLLSGYKIYFKANGLLYTRETDEGIASLNINLPSGTYSSSSNRIIAWFDGGKYSDQGAYTGNTGDYAYSELVSTNFTVNKAPTVNFEWGSDSKGHYVKVTNSTRGYPLRYHTVSLNIASTGAFSVETDGDGKAYFRLTGYSGSVSVSATVSESSRVTTGKTGTNTFNL